jgi:nitrogen fixation protein FixH
MSCCGVFIMPQDLPASRAMPRRDFRLNGWHVLTGFIAFFGVVVGVNGYMMRAAISTMPGLDARNGYDVSQRYNAQIAEAQTAERSGIRAGLSLSRLGQTETVTIDLTNRLGAPVTGHHVALALEHPATRVLDRKAAAQETKPGSYSGLLADMPPGAWTVVTEVRATPHGPLLFASRNRVMVRPEAQP